MKVRVLFFGATAYAADSREIDIEFVEGESVGLFVDRIGRQFPRLKDHRLIVALNEEYSELNAVLKEGDELAIFTAVSGG